MCSIRSLFKDPLPSSTMNVRFELPPSPMLSILSAISSFKAAPELIFANFSLLKCIPNGFPYSCSMTSVTSDTFSSDILIFFGLTGLYSVVDSSNPVSLWSSWIDDAAPDLVLKSQQFLRNVVL